MAQHIKDPSYQVMQGFCCRCSAFAHLVRDDLLAPCKVSRKRNLLGQCCGSFLTFSDALKERKFLASSNASKNEIYSPRGAYSSLLLLTRSLEGGVCSLNTTKFSRLLWRAGKECIDEVESPFNLAHALYLCASRDVVYSHNKANLVCLSGRIEKRSLLGCVNGLISAFTR